MIPSAIAEVRIPLQLQVQTPPSYPMVVALRATAETVTPPEASVAQLVEALPGWIRAELPVERRIAGTVTEEDLVGTCRTVRPDVEISFSAWDEAERTIGAFRAAIVLVIAAARSTPDWPEEKRVRRPGGFFRAVSRRVYTGEADLGASIHGILAHRFGRSRHASS